MSIIVASDGVELYAEAHGEGTPVLLSCGMCTTHVNFRPQVAPLVEAGYRVVLWDYRGHGLSQSPAEAEAYTLEQVVDDLGRVLDWGAPGAEPAVVGGLSFGGLASLHYALAEPDRVMGLLLIDSGPGFKNPKALEGWMAQVERTASYLETRGARAFVESRAGITAVGLRPELPAAQAAADAIAAQNIPGLAHFARCVAGPAPPVIDQLAEICAEALVLVGEKDEPYLRAAEVMAARLPNASHVVIPGAGHISNLEETAAFNQAVLQFLARVAPRGS
ncbi:alpha/beta hydrolase [Myxococcota bacterium]|nr:alpha/beta hydrolase [Myxococcota bacterium]